MRRRFVTLDVFTATRFAGNPLAVVLDAEGLDTATMQTVAREFNHPETVFVLPPDNAAHRARLRIFTPAAELPFAGHPTVGTAALLGRIDGGTGARKIVVEEKIGPVACEVTPIDADTGRTVFALPRLPEQDSGMPDAATSAAALGLAASDIDGVPSRWSAGNAMSYVPIKSLAALGRARPDPARFDATFKGKEPAKVFLYCRETAEPGHDFRARMFAPAMGIPEDPATGSAVGAFAGLLATSGQYGDGTHNVLVAQGYEMGRPSQIELALTIAGGKLTAASVGGSAIVVTEGAIEA